MKFGDETVDPAHYNDLPYRLRSLQVRYAALTFAQESAVLFRYRLGTDRNWLDTTQRELNYPQLPPGQYTLEVMARGKYLWIPLEQVDQLAMNAPKYPRDLLWFPVNLQMRDGQTGEVFLPVLYPGSHTSPDPQIKLGRATDWISSEGGPVRGIGARSMLVDEDAMDIREWRQVIITD